MTDIKIFMACHKDDITIPDNNLIVPIQVGTALASRKFENMAHDDEGQNISEKNPRYCELTAIYWMWKHCEADYIGLFHYRRYLSFSETVFPTNLFADALFETNDDKTLQEIGLEEENMRKIIEQNDFIMPEAGRFADDVTMRDQYDLSIQHHIEDLECVMDILEERYPDMVDVANRYLDGTTGYFCNMFIMKKELFGPYCEWLFSILEEHEKRRDISSYDPACYRVSGYLAERLCGIYFTWLKEQGTYTYCELQRPFFEDVSQPKLLKPVFKKEDNPVTLVLSANDFYSPYLGTLLQSIKENISASRFYDIIVLHSDISTRNQQILSRIIAGPNCSIRFLCTRYFMRQYEDRLYLRAHFKIETYFRLLMQDLLPDYSKALYLDADMVVTQDIAELYDTDLEGYLLAACKDADTAGLYNGFEPPKVNYMENVLKIKDPFGYFQAGTILFNLDEFRKQYTVDEIFDFATSYEWQLLDQDVLNYLTQGHVKYVDMKWNLLFDWADFRIKEIISRAPRYLYLEYMEARKHPAIIHYAGPDKPWDDLDSDFADYFWKYALKTPYAAIILQRKMAGMIPEPEPEPEPMPEPEPAPSPTAKDRVWNVFFPVYEFLFPMGTNRREKMSYRYQKMRGRI